MVESVEMPVSTIGEVTVEAEIVFRRAAGLVEGVGYGVSRVSVRTTFSEK